MAGSFCTSELAVDSEKPSDTNHQWLRTKVMSSITFPGFCVKSNSLVGVNVLADARAEARNCSPNTRRAYVAGWNDFTSWCLEHRCAVLPTGPADIGRYLEHLVVTEGRTMANTRMRLAAIAAAHRLGGHEDPTTRPLVKAIMKRLAGEYGKPRKQAKGLTSEALAEDIYTFMACTLGAPIPDLGSTNTAPAKGKTSWPYLELL